VHIDWEGTAREVKMDYSYISIGEMDYLYRWAKTLQGLRVRLCGAILPETLERWDETRWTICT
jgi:hypothetical protein